MSRGAVTARKATPIGAGAGRLFVIGALLVAAAAITSVVLLVSLGRVTTDWVSFYAAGLLLRTGRAAHLYDLPLQAATQRQLVGPGVSPTAYPMPVFVAALFAPLTRLSLAVSYTVWFAVNLALLGVLTALAWRWLAGVRPALRGVFLACALPITLRVLLLGQVDLFVLAGFAGCYALLHSNRPFSAGCLLAAALFKPHLVVGIGLLLLVKRQWRALAGFSLAGGLLLIVPPLLIQPRLMVDQLRLLLSDTSGMTGYGVDAPMMINIRGTIASISGSSNPWLWLPPLAVVTAVAVYAAVRVWTARPASHAQSWALAFVLPLLYSSHVHMHSLVLLTPAAALFLIDAQSAGRPVIQIKHIAFGLLAVTVLWALTYIGIALMAFLVMGVYALFSRRWPEPAAALQRLPDRAELALAS